MSSSTYSIPACILVVLAVGCAGCLRETEPAPVVPPFVHEAARPRSGTVWLSCRGYVRADTPEGYASILPRVPIESLAPEGAWVDPGEELFTLGTTLAQQWSAERKLRIKEKEEEEQADRLQTAKTIEDLELRKAELEKEIEVLSARIAATLERDKQQVRVAELEVEAAHDKVRRARARVERLRPLHAKGIVSRRVWRDATASLARAEEAARIPDVRLDVLKHSTLAATRQLLRLEQAMVQVEMGDEEQGGVFGDIDAQWDQLELELQLKHTYLRRLYDDEREAAELFSKFVVRATVGGVVRHRGSRRGKPEVGYRPGRGAMMYVLSDNDMCFTMDLPERWRDVYSLPGDTNTVALSVRVDVPGIGVRDIAARIVSTSTLPVSSRVPGQRHYACQVVPERPMPGLKDGMQVICRVPVALPAGAVCVPTWVVGRGKTPRVVLDDGSVRPVMGQRVGATFVVLSGLSAGDRVRGRPDTARSSIQRYKGYIRPVEVRDLHVPFHTEIQEMVAEGTAVKQGDVVARCTSTDRRQPDHEAEAREQRAAAKAQLEIDRVKADSLIAAATVAWRKAELAVRKQWLAARVARYARDDEERVKGDAALNRARLDREAARATFEELRAQEGTGTLSDQELRAAALDTALAGISVRKAEMERAAMRRRRNWLDVWDAEDAAYRAEDAALAARSDYSLERQSHGLAMRQSIESYERTMAGASRHMEELAKLTVRAPFDGHVYYNRDGDHPTLQTGRRLQTMTPFNMPVGPDTEAVIELPARLYGRFKPGDPIEVVVPALGPEPIECRVGHLSPHFHESEQALEDMLLGEAVGAPPIVFTVRIAIPRSAQTEAVVKPGMNAWIEVSS